MSSLPPNRPANSFLPSPLKEGVRFTCTDCGACCSGVPGKVRLSDREITAISEFRNQSEMDFRASEVRVIDGENLLKEELNGDCVFFKNNRCLIHPVKPTQCRTYPFWFKNVRNDAAWAKTSRECPGIGEGEYYSPEDIVQKIQNELSK